MAWLLEHTIFAGGTQLAVTIVVFFLSQVVYALFGFGAGILSVAVLAFFFADLADVVALLLFVTLPTELVVVARHRRRVPLRELGGLLAGMALGLVGGTLLLEAGSGEAWLFRLLGVVLVSFAAYFHFVEDRLPTRTPPAGSAPAAGALAGLLGGTFGTGGPPVILYLRLRGLDKQTFRATLLAVFLGMSLVRLPLYLARGIADETTLVSAMLVIPGGLVGMALGNHLHVGLSESRFRQGTAIVIALLGALLLARGGAA